MKTQLFLLLSFLFFTSCITQNRIDRKCRKAKLNYEIANTKWGCQKDRDSTFTQSQVIIKDTTIFVPVPGQAFHDSIPLIITKGLMNSPVSLLETTYSRSRAWVENGILKHTLDQRPSTIPVILPGAIHTSTSNTMQTIKVPYYVVRPIAKPLLWWQKLFVWSGVIAWWVLVLYIVIKFYKFRIG